ncbi:hypothetical protein CHS0354_022736 [Potamilus streckersoni]|uniref:Uncharacterized protein n=1 Tax=Potamilus streckersoni TaxID=2493646 RepID=A0AAE0VIT8_9BIVA|nr:hypothetical protein CHS0354_022736 [Potamilus streckersoni]
MWRRPHFSDGRSVRPTRRRHTSFFGRDSNSTFEGWLRVNRRTIHYGGRESAPAQSMDLSEEELPVQTYGTPDDAVQPHGTPDDAVQTYGTPDDVVQPHGTPDGAVQTYGTPDDVVQPNGTPDDAVPSWHT